MHSYYSTVTIILIIDNYLFIGGDGNGDDGNFGLFSKLQNISL
jgi:hypothetical protein